MINRYRVRLVGFNKDDLGAFNQAAALAGNHKSRRVHCFIGNGRWRRFDATIFRPDLVIRSGRPSLPLSIDGRKSDAVIEGAQRAIERLIDETERQRG